MMPDATWKRVERALAKRMGGVRTSKAGHGEAVPDVENRWLSVEAKSRKALPSWLVAAMEQAETNASAGLLPIVVLHQVGWRHDKDLVVLRLGEFLDRFGDIEEEA